MAISPQDRERILAYSLPYEIAMMKGTFKRLASAAPSELVNNVLIEGLLLHVRVLRDFFFLVKPKKPDDVLALDYAPTYTPLLATKNALSDFDQKINPQIMHLAYRREISWWLKVDRSHQTAFVEALLQEVQRFEAALESKWKAVWDGRTKAEIE